MDSTLDDMFETTPLVYYERLEDCTAQEVTVAAAGAGAIQQMPWRVAVWSCVEGCVCVF
eukprot:m.1560605 g.1560605  ORF g.1560605 m.1560605 type:complete len:59 (-) comp25277_c0_seq43:3495-3671(-)